MSRRAGVVIAVLAMVGAVVVAAVMTRGGRTPEVVAEVSRPAPAPSVPPTGQSTDAGAAPLATSVVGSECEDAPGRRVQQLEDLVVPAVDVAAVLDADGNEVLAAFTVPAALVDSGCVIRYDAPGGCLGAVEVTAATIPAATLPTVALQAVALPGGRTVAAQEVPGVEAPAVEQPGAYAPRVCQVERDGRIETVSRAGVVREGFSRDGVARSGLTRTEQCDDEECVPAVTVPAVRLEPVRLPDVDVDPGRLESRRLEQDVSVVSGEDRVSYVAPGAVLFETESAALRPAAEQSLRSILDAIDPDPSTRLLVEGHTDDRGSAAYGLRLSRQRADTVAQWLVRNGVRPSRVTTDGLGETAPAVPNTSEKNRARNRRVVITVLP